MPYTCISIWYLHFSFWLTSLCIILSGCIIACLTTHLLKDILVAFKFQKILYNAVMFPTYKKYGIYLTQWLLLLFKNILSQISLVFKPNKLIPLKVLELCKLIPSVVFNARFPTLTELPSIVTIHQNSLIYTETLRYLIIVMLRCLLEGQEFFFTT